MTQQRDFQAVDDALRTYPIPPAPATLLPGTMARVRATAPLRFRLNWLDYALCSFATVMVGLSLLLWQPSLHSLTHVYLALVRLWHAFQWLFIEAFAWFGNH